MALPKNLTPFQRKEFEKWPEEDLVWISPKRPPHLHFHDVDRTYLTGMFEVLPNSVGGDIDKELSESLRYPVQRRYGKERDLLPPLAVKLKLKNMLEFEKVQRHLGQLKRVAVETKADYNCAINAVTLQVKVPKHFTNDTVRHQLAEHMVEEYIYYYPKMLKYLQQNKLSYSSYIMNLYSGHIWADEFMLGALGRMFNLKITVVSPAYDDIWNIFHTSGLPHVVIVANGGDFGHKHGVTHFSATKGPEDAWKCVGADTNVGELGMRKGYDAAVNHCLAVFREKEKVSLLKTTRKVTKDVEDLSHDLKQLYIRRDKIYAEMASMGLKVDEFKRFETFYDEAAATTTQAEGSHDKKSKKHKERKSSKSDKKSRKSSEKFPQDIREKILSEALPEINTGKEEPALPDQSTIDDILQSRPRRCRIKNARQPVCPSLPQRSTDIEQDSETSTITATEKQLHQWTVDTEAHNPYNLDTMQTDVTQEPGIVETRPMSPEAQMVITEQPKKMGDDIFTRKRERESSTASPPKKKRITDDTETTVVYRNIRMTKQVADILQIQNKEEMLAKVHQICTESKTTTAALEHDNTDNTDDPTEVIPDVPDVQLLHSDKMLTQAKGTFDETVWEDAELDEEGNIIGFKNQPELQVFIPSDQIQTAKKSAIPTHENAADTITVENIPAAVEEIVTTTEKNEGDKEKLHMDSLPQVHQTKKKGKQPSVRIFFPPPPEQPKRVQPQQVIDVTGTEEENEDEIIIEEISEEEEKELLATRKSAQDKQSKAKTTKAPADVAKTKTRITLNRPGSKKTSKKVQKPEFDRIIVSIPQNLDTSHVEPPIPEGERLDHMLYCNRCNFSTPDRRYLQKHNTRQCEMLTVVERLKCTEEGCKSLFIHENSLRDHVRQHRGHFNYECPKCGKKFMLQNQLARHKKKC